MIQRIKKSLKREFDIFFMFYDKRDVKIFFVKLGCLVLYIAVMICIFAVVIAALGKYIFRG